MKRRNLIAMPCAIAIALPFAARAQKPTLPTVGFLSSLSPAEWAPFVDAFRNGLKEAGFVEGRNVAIEFRWAMGQYERLPALAAELVQREVSVIVGTGGARSALAAKAATSTIPIVFSTAGDPVASGLVASLGRPGGNVTGVTLIAGELMPKRMELLRQLAPKATEIALFVNPRSTATEAEVSKALQQARTHGLLLRVLRVSTEQEIATAMASFTPPRPGAMLIGTDPVLRGRSAQFVELAARYGVPAVYEGRESVDTGGLASFGPSLAEAYRQIGIYTGRILKGARPADLPVLQPTRFELVINLKTARALGITVPQSLLLRADEVIQ